MLLTIFGEIIANHGTFVLVSNSFKYVSGVSTILLFLSIVNL